MASLKPENKEQKDNFYDAAISVGETLRDTDKAFIQKSVAVQARLIDFLNNGGINAKGWEY
tara:strand:+ start:329 stop:511 length:183 start_codon:yes stop_codon:yes gene_type:complete